jgi:hypothetical protein
MSEVFATLPEVSDQHAFNLARWGELLADPFIASLDYRIETNRHGQIVMIRHLDSNIPAFKPG